jgi:glycosyltransferase involved in cell wall biosynthesis
MRILFCNYEYPPLGGGAGVTTALLAEELAKRHDVTVLTSQGLDQPLERVESGVRVIRVPVFFRKQAAVANLLSMFTFIPMAIRKGKKLLETTQYDIINTHFVLPTGPVGDVLSRSRGVPNVLFLHGGDLYDPSKFTSPHRHLLLRAWIRRLLRRADTVAAHSKNILETMRHFYTPEIEGVRIPAMIPRPQIGAACRHDYGCREDEVLLVTVGRLIARKATTQLISLMEALRGEKVRLLIVGTGPQERLLKAEIVKRQLSDQIHFLGRVEEAEKFRILQMCDIYVSSSQHEGFGLVFLEAMACGLPIVCYDYGGQMDFLENATTGFLLPLNDLVGLEEQCRCLIKDHELRHKIGQENLHRIEEFFVDRCARRYEAVLQDAAARRSKAPPLGQAV